MYVPAKHSAIPTVSLFSQEDGMLLKFVNDTNRSIYAFEMLPPPAIDAPNDISNQPFSSEDCVANNTVTVIPKSSSQLTDVLHTCDIVNDLLLSVAASSRNQSPVPADDAFATGYRCM